MPSAWLFWIESLVGAGGALDAARGGGGCCADGGDVVFVRYLDGFVGGWVGQGVRDVVGLAEVLDAVGFGGGDNSSVVGLVGFCFGNLGARVDCQGSDV